MTITANSSNNKIVSIYPVTLEKKYYRFGNHFESVILTEEDYENLIRRFGRKQADDWIDDLDIYMRQTGKSYHCHYATIISWAKRENDKRRLIQTGEVCFNLDVAKEWGVYEAIVLKYFKNEIMLLSSKKLNLCENRTWLELNYDKFYGDLKFIEKEQIEMMVKMFLDTTHYCMDIQPVFIKGLFDVDGKIGVEMIAFIDEDRWLH